MKLTYIACLAGFAAMLAGCYSPDTLRGTEPAGTPFQKSLAMFYTESANTYQDRYDWADATHFADKGLNVGLDFSFRFQAPVRLDDLVNLRWTMTGRMPKLSLKGDIITLEGEAVRSDGIVAVSASAHVLLLNSKTKADASV